MNDCTDKEKALIKKSLEAVAKDDEMLSGVIEFFPFPIQVYTPDGSPLAGKF